MERLRAGVIGVGAIAQIMHLPYLRELDDRFQIAALCDVDPVVLAEVGRQYGVNRLFASADELLNEPLDVVLILSSGDHGPVTIAALERGCTSSSRSRWPTPCGRPTTSSPPPSGPARRSWSG